MGDLSRVGFDISQDQPKDIRRIASENRRFIFRTLLQVKDDTALIGHIVTKVAKENGLVNQDKAKIKGVTIQEWINSWETDGKNTANAWACQAGSIVLIESDQPLVFDSKEAYLAVLYYLSPSLDKDVLLKSQGALDKKIV